MKKKTCSKCKRQVYPNEIASEDPIICGVCHDMELDKN